MTEQMAIQEVRDLAKLPTAELQARLFAAQVATRKATIAIANFEKSKKVELKQLQDEYDAKSLISSKLLAAYDKKVQNADEEPVIVENKELEARIDELASAIDRVENDCGDADEDDIKDWMAGELEHHVVNGSPHIGDDEIRAIIHEELRGLKDRVAKIDHRVVELEGK